MANIFIKAASGLMEKMLDVAEVTDVRAWQPATIIEVDLHLPTISMEKWDTIKRLKCKVGEYEYRDYTPLNWNAEKRTCTLIVEAAHEGAGSRWARGLKKGDEILLGAAHAAQLPSKEGRILCLGDGSALGHFLALKQLTDRAGFPMESGIFLHGDYLAPAFFVENNPEFELLMKPDSQSVPALEEWCGTKELSEFSYIYIAGNIPMVSSLRKKLKTLPGIRAKIVGHGFWS